jgi:NAD(P)-dependent dehydrogenase (short-subunit alcohol dehydrogenase family)
MSRLDGKVALITGAARGIGAAIARAFITEGARVWVTDVSDETGCRFAAELGPNARFAHLDVREEADWSSVIVDIVGTAAGRSEGVGKAGIVVGTAGRLDIVVNNAGITGFESGAVAHDPENASLEDWRAVHRTNLDGVFLGCKYAIRAMRPAKAGSIINISSRSGLVGIPGAAAYASSKAAVRNHTKSVALWCAQEGLTIRCNSIHPAAVLTPMWEPMLGSGPDREIRMAAFVKDTPLRRFGTPEEVAALATLLASDEASYITGSEFNIDGGLLAGAVAAPTRE